MSGYVHWFDASTLPLADGAGVTAWPDGGSSGGNATVPGSNRTPVYVADAGTETHLGAVYFDGAGGANGSMALRFTRDSAIRTVFSVFKGNSFMLTDGGAYNFHRASDTDPAAPIINNDASAAIVNGKTYVNKVLVTAPKTTAMPTSLHNGFNLVEILTDGNAVAAESFNKDRTYHAGNQYQAEVIIYDRVLNETERVAVEDYLYLKWLTPQPPLPPTGLVATPLPASIRLDWTASTGATGYKVERLDGSGGTVLFTYDASGTTYTATADSNVGINQTATVIYTMPPVAIAWGSATTLSSSTDVSTVGTLLYAKYFSAIAGAPAITVVNGVTFAKQGASTAEIAMSAGAMVGTSSVGAGSVTDPDYQKILIAPWYNAGTVTLNGLTSGMQYQVQVWAQDARYNTGNYTNITGGPGLLIDSITDGNQGVNSKGFGQFAIGTFTANASTQNIAFSGASVVNAIQVRDVTPRPAAAANSTVTATPTSVASDGVTPTTVTVTLRSADSIPCFSKTVTLASDRGAADTISAASGLSSGAGVVTFTVTSSTPGTSVFTATDVTDDNLVIAPSTATVTFTSDTVSAAMSAVTASPTSVQADGSATSTITVTLRNGTGNPLVGKSVTLAKTSGPGTPVIDPASATTDDFGVATFTVTSTTAGADVFSATDTEDSVMVAQTATVTFTAGAVSSTASTVTSSPSSVIIDGVSTSTITVTLKDANNNPVAGKTVTLASDRTTADTISPTSGDSDASGVVAFTVSSSTPGTSVYTATDVTDDNLVISPSTATVTFTTLVIGGQQFSPGDVLPSPIIAVSGDLLETSVASVTGEVDNQKVRNGTTGTAKEESTQNPASVGLHDVIYNLDLTASPVGYDIKEIRLFSGWDEFRTGQSYRIEYATAASPSTFTVFGTVLALRDTGGSLLTRTYDTTGANILTGVAALRFVMIDIGNVGSGTVFREIDVLGTATSGTTPYDTWAQGPFANGATLSDKDPAHDPDGDGMTNQQEFAFGLDPTTGASVNPITVPLDKATGVFKYTRTKNSGLAYVYQWSATLSEPWDVFTPVIDPPATSISATVEEVTVTVPAVWLENNSTLFLRVKAQ
ncbi:MAG: Ig-like domain-containing protein [Verrucomicrobia bacterium]|nr:Ig-like domain-containing protein [Verrucomicrobiota bacterium]